MQVLRFELKSYRVNQIHRQVIERISTMHYLYAISTNRQVSLLFVIYKRNPLGGKKYVLYNKNPNQILQPADALLLCASKIDTTMQYIRLHVWSRFLCDSGVECWQLHHSIQFQQFCPHQYAMGCYVYGGIYLVLQILFKVTKVHHL